MPNPIYLRSNGAVDSSITDLIQTFESKTISGDSITFTASAATLDTQDGAATDNLSTIVATNAQVGNMLMLRSTSDARRIVIKHDVGNIWSAGGDITLKSPRQLLFLIYDGAYWVVFGCCGSSADAPEVEPDEGEELKCIIATRVVDYVALMLGDVASVIAGGLVSVAAKLNAYFTLVGASASPADVLALANTIINAYADDTAFEADFTEGVFVSARCYAYCAKDAEDTQYTSGDVSTLQDFISGESGTEWDILSSVFAILGADGMTNAIATSVLVATDADCGGDCACHVAFSWETTSQTTIEGETVYANVVLHVGGGGTLTGDIEVNITTAGTASGVDYTLVTTSVTFPSGSGDGDTQQVEVEIVTDVSADDGETIILGLDPDEGEVEPPSTHTILITPCYTFDFTANDGDFTVSAFNGFWETAAGWRTGATPQNDGFSDGYRFHATRTLAADVDVASGSCDLAGGYANAIVYFYDVSNVLLYTWTVTSGGSGTSVGNALPAPVSNVRKVVIIRSVISGLYTGPAYMTNLELCLS